LTTGAWIKDLFDEYPKSQFIGIDIVDTKFETVLSQASNVSFILLNFDDEHTDTFVKAEQESFDLINQRYMIAAYKKQRWGEVFKRYYQLLKPGGWVQILEPNSFNAGSSRPNSYLRRVRMLYNKVSESRGLDPFIPQVFPKLLRQAGFTEFHLQYGGVTSRQLLQKLPEDEVQPKWEQDPDIIFNWYSETLIGLSSHAVDLGFVTKEEFEELSEGLKAELSEGGDWTRYETVSLWGKVIYAYIPYPITSLMISFAN
jgi:SAM-dependent methyltransferase